MKNCPPAADFQLRISDDDKELEIDNWQIDNAQSAQFFTLNSSFLILYMP